MLSNPPSGSHLTFVLLLFVASSAPAAAQESRWAGLDRPAFMSPLRDSASIEGPVTSVTEDSSGFIWLVASNGLWRWDSHILLHTTFRNPGHSAPQPTIQSSITDKSGQLWVGTNRGLYKIPPGTNVLEPVAPGLLSNISVQTIAIAATPQDEQIIVLGTDRDVYQFDVAGQRLLPIEMPTDTRTHALHIDQQSKLWVGTESGLFTSPMGAHHFADLVPESGFPNTVRVSSITSTQNGEVVIGSAADGLFISSAAGDFQHIPLNRTPPPWLYTITEIRPNVLLLGTFGEGLIEVNLTTGTERHYLHDRSQEATLSDNNIWTVFKDSRGLVWIGAGDSLNIYDADNTAVKNLLGQVSSARGLQQRKVSSVQNVGDSLWVGSGQHGIEVLAPYVGHTKVFWPDSQDPVETLYASPGGEVYASSNFQSVSIDASTGEVTPLSTNSRTAEIYTSAFAQTNEALWLGGTDGLWMQPRSEMRTIIEVFDANTKEWRVASLLADKNTLWIGTWQGLIKGSVQSTSPYAGTLTNIDHPVLSQQFISALFIDSKSQLWVGTSGEGLFVHTKESDWQQILDTNGLPGKAVAAIAGESREHIWLSTSRGIAAVNINTREVTPVIVGSASISSPYSRGAATQTSTAQMAFGGVNGLTMIDTRAVSFSPKTLPFVLTNTRIVSANNEVISPSLKQRQLVIPALSKRVSFEFTALDYLDPDHLSYRYRLLGLDDNWTLLDVDHRIVTVTRPPPGHYTLQIEYSHDGKNWQSNTLSRQFSVLPAWYQTVYAKIAGLLILCMVIYFTHRLGVRHSRRRQATLEQRVHDRTAELVKANEKLAEQAKALEEASLTDALTGSNNRRFLMQNIHRDITVVQRYYADCKQNNTAPSNESDLLFFLIDLDHFKQINDTFGHQVGDTVLVETQRRLKSMFRESDYLIRWGGEEFLVVVHNTPREGASYIAERILQTIGDEPFDLEDGLRQQVTCSVGFAAYPITKQHPTMFEWQTTVAIADAALYGAKNDQRDTWMGFTAISPDLDDNILQQIKQQPSLISEYGKLQRR